MNAFVYADEPHSIAFAEQLGLVEVDYQLEQVRAIGDEPAPALPPGLELVSLDGRREELLAAAWDVVATEAYEDLPLPGEVTYQLESGCAKRRRAGRLVRRVRGRRPSSAGRACPSTRTATQPPSTA